MAPPKEFKDNKELYQYYDEMALKIADEEQILMTAMDEVRNLFVADVKYTDKSGQEQLSKLPQDPNSANADDWRSIYESLYGEGKQCLREVTRPSTVPSFMMWYCRTRGVTEEEIITLGKNPNSPEAQTVKNKVSALRQDFKELMSSNDPERLSEFLVGTFAEFEKQKERLKTVTDLQSFAENWKYLGQFMGVTGLQQSLEDDGNNRTKSQEKLIGKLNEKIAAKFGPNVKLNDVIATMSLIHAADQSLVNDGITSRENVKLAEEGGSKHIKLSEVKFNRRARMTRMMRGFHAVSDTLHQGELKGEQHFYSKELGHSAAFNVAEFLFFEPSMADGDIEEDLRKTESEIRLLEMKCYAGDPNGNPLYNLEEIQHGSYTYEGQLNKNGQPVSYVDTVHNFETIQATFNIDEANAAYNSMNEPATVMRNGKTVTTTKLMADLETRLQQHQKLRNQDIAIYKSKKNVAYTKELQELERKIQNRDIGFRPSALKDPVFAAMITQNIEVNYGITLENYILGRQSIATEASQSYAQTAKEAIDNPGASLISEEYHNKMMKELDKELKPVGVTLASSAEFKNLNTSFQALKDPKLRLPGNEAKYREAMTKFSEACKTYIHAKEADGKKERSTDRGQIRYNLAKKMAAFASSSLDGMETVRKALAEHEKTLSYAKLKSNPDMQRRVVELMSPNAPGSQELINAHVYESSYKPIPIPSPENNPFNDYQMSLIAVGALTEGSMFRGTFRDNPFLTNRELGQEMHVHSTVDIFLHLRANAHDVVSQYDVARQIAHDNVEKYVQGNPKPLAEMLGNNIRVCIEQLHNRESMNEDVLASTEMAQEIMSILRNDPELMENSHLSREELQNFKKLENYAKLYEDHLEVIEQLKQDSVSHHLTEEARTQFRAEAIAFALIQEENREITTNFRETNPTYKKAEEALLSGIANEGIVKRDVLEAERKLNKNPNNVALQEKLQKETQKHKRTKDKMEVAQFGLSIVENEKGYSKILEESVGKSYEKFKADLLEKIKENPHLSEISLESILKGDPDRKIIKQMNKDLKGLSVIEKNDVKDNIQKENPKKEELEKKDPKKEDPKKEKSQQVKKPSVEQEIDALKAKQEEQYNSILKEKAPEENYNDKVHQEKNLYAGPDEDKRYSEFAKFGKLNDINPYKMVSELAVDAMERVHNACTQRKGYQGVDKDLKIMALNQILHGDRKSAGFNNIPGRIAEDLMRNCKTKEEVKERLLGSNLGNPYAETVAPLFNKNAPSKDKAQVLKEFVYGNKAEQIAENSLAIKVGDVVRVKDEKNRNFVYGNNIEEIKKTISGKHADKAKEMSERLKAMKGMEKLITPKEEKKEVQVEKKAEKGGMAK